MYDVESAATQLFQKQCLIVVGVFNDQDTKPLFHLTLLSAPPAGGDSSSTSEYNPG